MVDHYSFCSTVWTDEAWLQKYGNLEEAKENEEKEETTKDAVQTNEQDVSSYVPSSTKRGQKCRVYLDIEIGNNFAGRIEIELRGDVVPKTAGIVLFKKKETTTK